MLELVERLKLRLTLRLRLSIHLLLLLYLWHVALLRHLLILLLWRILLIASLLLRRDMTRRRLRILLLPSAWLLSIGHHSLVTVGRMPVLLHHLLIIFLLKIRSDGSTAPTSTRDNSEEHERTSEHKQLAHEILVVLLVRVRLA